MRTALNLAALCSVVALASCDFDRLEGAVEVHVTQIPGSAVRAEAVLTDSSGGTTKREPHFGVTVYTSSPSDPDEVLVLTFPPFPEGNFTVQVTAYDIDDTPLAIGNGAGTYTTATTDTVPLPVINIVLHDSSPQPGTYGTQCVLNTAGLYACSGGLVCNSYGTGDHGVCTHACGEAEGCDAEPAGAVCEAFLGDAANTYCQFECGTGLPACPTDLICGAPVSASGGKRFCQGTSPE